jgi:hypothetical protein
MPPTSLDFDDLARELDLWAGEGRVVLLWWRDDDATTPTPALTKLLDLSDAYEIEAAVAVIPATAAATLPEAIDGHRHTAILQHGYAHKNHARPGAKSVECGGDRPVEDVLRELAEGSRQLKELFGARAEKILAVPWNRIERPVLEGLADVGFRGASAYGPRAAVGGAGVLIANAHVDPMNWRERRFAGFDKALSSFLGELRARRTGATEKDEPIGLLTHHLDHDAPFWDFLDRLFRVTKAHAATRWITVAEAFAPAPSRQAGIAPE